jgi:hypothetical protein
MVGCTHPVVMASIVAIASNPPAAPRQWPIIDWQGRRQITLGNKDTKKRILPNKKG